MEPIARFFFFYSTLPLTVAVAVSLSPKPLSFLSPIPIPIPKLPPTSLFPSIHLSKRSHISRLTPNTTNNKENRTMTTRNSNSNTPTPTMLPESMFPRSRKKPDTLLESTLPSYLANWQSVSLFWIFFIFHSIQFYSILCDIQSVRLSLSHKHTHTHTHIFKLLTLLR